MQESTGDRLKTDIAEFFRAWGVSFGGVKREAVIDDLAEFIRRELSRTRPRDWISDDEAKAELQEWQDKCKS